MHEVRDVPDERNTKILHQVTPLKAFKIITKLNLAHQNVSLEIYMAPNPKAYSKTKHFKCQ